MAISKDDITEIKLLKVRILMDGQFLKNVKEDFIENTKRLS